MTTASSKNQNNIIEATNSQFVTKDVQMTEDYRTTPAEETEEVKDINDKIDYMADVDITEIHSSYNAEGEQMDMVFGTVDGHAAEFYVGEDGKVIVGTIDTNDDGITQADEIIDFTDADVTETDLIVRDDVGESIVPVEIQSVQHIVNAEGEIVDLISATVDGHEALFVDDTDCNIVAAAIDLNDDGEIGEDEVMTFEEGQLTATQLIMMETVATEPEVEITGIEEVTNVAGETVDLVTATIDGHEAIFIDDAEGNIVFGGVDSNDDGQLDFTELTSYSGTGVTIDDLLYADSDGIIPCEA